MYKIYIGDPKVCVPNNVSLQWYVFSVPLLVGQSKRVLFGQISQFEYLFFIVPMSFCMAFGTGLLHMSIQDAPNGRVNFEVFFITLMVLL